MLVFIFVILLVFVLDIPLLLVSIFVFPFTFALMLVFLFLFILVATLRLVSMLLSVSVLGLNRTSGDAQRLESPVLLHLPPTPREHWGSFWAVRTSIEAFEFCLTWDRNEMALCPPGALGQEKLHK